LPDSVYQRVRNATDNSGRPLLDFSKDKEVLMGKPVYISPSLPNVIIGSPSIAQSGVILFGDLSHFRIRCSRPTIQRCLEQGITDITKGETLSSPESEWTARYSTRRAVVRLQS
jgi:HK97 family phage major capsid protein